MKKSELRQIIKEELKNVMNEAPNKIKGGITKHFSDYSGTDTYKSIQNLEKALLFYVKDTTQPLDLDDIAHIVMDIVDYAMDHARNEID